MFQRRLISFLLVSLVSILGLSVTLWFDSFASLDRALWDWRLRQNAKEFQPDPRIKIIMIDDASIEHYSRIDSLYSWPWMRQFYVPVIKFLERAGAKALAIDLIYTESSARGVEDDQIFAKALDGNIPVILALAANAKGSPRLGNGRDALSQKQKQSLDTNWLGTDLDLFMTVQSVTPPIPELLGATRAVGSVNAVLDQDGIVRHYPFGVKFEDIPVMALAPAILAASGYEISGEYIRRSLNSDGALTLAYPFPEPGYPKYSIRNIIDSYVALEEGLQPIVPLETFRDSYVFLGAYAYALLDFRPTPLSERAPGVEVNAAALDNILNKKLIREAPYIVNILISGLLIIAAAALSLLPSRVIHQVFGVIGLIIAVIAISLLTTYSGIRIEMGSMVVWLVGATLFSVGYRYYFEGGQYRFIKRAFAQYLSPELVNEIAKQPELLQLGGERKKLTILFSDIRGFTSISETLSPADLSALLNRYLSTVTDVILESGGTLDKYIGDAVVAFWNAPLPLEHHASCGVGAALKCQEKLSEMRASLASQFGVTLRSGIGLHTGDVVVGNFGSERRFAYTVLGDSANLASRLEGANKAFGTSTIISGATRAELDSGFHCRKVGSARVVGRKDVVEIYEPFRSPLDAELSSELSKFEEGLIAFEGGELKRASSIFESLTKDPVAKAYLQRLSDEFGKGKIPAKAAEGWSAIWNLMEK